MCMHACVCACAGVHLPRQLPLGFASPDSRNLSYSLGSALTLPCDTLQQAAACHQSPGYKCEATVLPRARGVWDTALQACFPVGKT